MNINKLLNRYGSSVYISNKEGWKSYLFHAFIQPLRYKTKLYMEGERTPIGINRNDVYLYIGPANHDLTKLAKESALNAEELCMTASTAKDTAKNVATSLV